MPSGMFLCYKFYDHSIGSTSNTINEIKVYTNYTGEALKSDNLLTIIVKCLAASLMTLSCFMYLVSFIINYMYLWCKSNLEMTVCSYLSILCKVVHA